MKYTLYVAGTKVQGVYPQLGHATRTDNRTKADRDKYNSALEKEGSKADIKVSAL